MRRTWKSRVIRAAAKLLAVTVTATSCLSGMAFTARAEGYGKNGVVRDMTSQQLVEDMGLGYNIGNTFDSIGSFITETDPWQYQKAWGNDLVSQLFIQKVKEGGFKTVRLPVSWAHWIDANNQINPGYLQAVQTVVDWCMDEDLYVILNVHHDSGAADTSWIRNAATDWDGTSAKYAAVWTQISSHFMNYGDHLIFEGMNEVEFPAAPTMSRQYEILNAMNQLFVDSVRATGGNNAVRHLLIPGYNTDIKKTCDRRYQMPNDPANHCILSIHYYSPSPFCVAEHDVDWAVPVTTWGSEEDIQNVEADLDILAEHFLSKGTPVIIGEYGVLTEDNKEKDSIRAYLKTVPEIIMQYGMCPVLWDTSNAGDMKTIERITGEFYDPVVKANYQALAQKKAFGQIQKRVFNFPTYQRVSLPIKPGGWASLNAYEPEKIQGVAFELDCTSDWDSYGGGGLYLDGWDDMPQWSFNSVYDEIVYMFSAEEKARLNDQLAVMIFWTDESKGGSRREELSIKNGQITLLYGENEQVNVPRILTGDSGSGGAIRSGGGGGGGRGGSSSPNYSTDPVGSQATEEAKLFASLHEGRNTIDGKIDGEGKAADPVEIDLAQLCPGYEIGDKVKIYVSYLSDDGATPVLITSENDYTELKDAVTNKNTVTCDFISPDGKVKLQLWWLGSGKYFKYKVSGEITEKASARSALIEDIAQNLTATDNSGEYLYSLNEVLQDSAIESGKRVKLTIKPAFIEGQENVKGTVWFEDESGAIISTRLVDEDEGIPVSSAVLEGTPRDSKLYFTIENREMRTRTFSRSAQPSMKILEIQAEVLPELGEGVVAELVTMQTVRVPADSNMITTVEAAAGEEAGMRVYFAFDGEDIHDQSKFSTSLIVGSDYHGNDVWDIRQDENGDSYIWYPGNVSGDISLTCWYNGGVSFKLKNIVQMQEVFPEFTVTEDGVAESDLAHVKMLLKEKGVTADNKVKIVVSAVTAKADVKFKGEVSLKDIKENTVVGQISEEGATIIGTFDADSLDFAAIPLDEWAEVKVYNPYTVTGISVEKLKKDTALAEFEKTGRIEVEKSNIEEIQTEGNTSALKIYYEFSGDFKNNCYGGLRINGTWIDAANWDTVTSGNENYIQYSCDAVSSLSIEPGYMDGKPLKIVKVVFEKKVEQEEPKPDVPELGEGEFLVEAESDGSYHIPAGGEAPNAIRVKVSGTGKTETNLVFDDWAKAEWVSFENGKEYTYIFPEEINFEKLSFQDDVDVESMVFICLDKVEINIGEDGQFHLPDTQIPKGILFSISDENKNGTMIALDNWSSGSSWVSINKDTKKGTYLFDSDASFEAFLLQGVTVESMVLLYPQGTEIETAANMANLRRALPLRSRIVLSQDEELFELPALTDENGNSYLPELPEEMGSTERMGIRAKVSSNSRDVTLIFDENEDSKVTVRPENKTIYYFFTEEDSMETVSFNGQEVEDVTFLFWNGEKAEAVDEDAEETGIFALPDYRIPAAVQFICSGEEDKEVKASLSVELYDAKAETWKEEGKILTNKLSVKTNGAGWYVFTEKDQEVLEDAFALAKDGYEAPRLHLTIDAKACAAEALTVYYHTYYTDEMEIVKPENEDTVAEKEDKAEAKEGKEAAKENAETNRPAEEKADKTDEADVKDKADAENKEVVSDKAGDAEEEKNEAGAPSGDDAQEPEEKEEEKNQDSGQTEDKKEDSSESKDEEEDKDIDAKTDEDTDANTDVDADTKADIKTGADLKESQKTEADNVGDDNEEEAAEDKADKAAEQV